MAEAEESLDVDRFVSRLIPYLQERAGNMAAVEVRLKFIETGQETIRAALDGKGGLLNEFAVLQKEFERTVRDVREHSEEDDRKHQALHAKLDAILTAGQIPAAMKWQTKVTLAASAVASITAILVALLSRKP